MKRYITSDLHISHAKAAIQRGFFDMDMYNHALENGINPSMSALPDKMNETIRSNWNSLITPEDKTYILGDVSFTSLTKTIEFLESLNGRKILIIGNHDKRHVKKFAFRQVFEAIYDYLEVGFLNTFAALFHYPIYQWNASHRGSIHFHGHTHNRPTNLSNRIKDCGLDTNALYPYDFEVLCHEMLKMPYSTIR